MQRASRQLLAATRALAQRQAPSFAGAGRGAGQEACCQALWRHYASEPTDLKKTVLHDLHVQLGGKMVDFAGWSMPIQYKDSIMDATVHCRTHASLFDVSHMCGFTLKGKDTIPFFESLVVGDIAGLENGTGCLSLYTNERGGVIDDTVVIKVSEDELYVVVNAGCRDKDLAHLNKHLGEWKAQGKQVAMTVHEDRSLLALQGPAAAEALQALTQADLSKQYFGGFNTFEAAGIPIWATRTGYTGEDGFEISVHNSKAEALTQKLMENPRVRLAGLGPRDSLRLEAGLCLYGNDLNEDITPIEGSLTWTIGKRRREKFDFLGGEVIKKQIAEGVTKRRVGFISSGAPARQHTEIKSNDGSKSIGEVTSGAFSPCLKKNIAMGYITKGEDKVGNKIKFQVRGKLNDAEVVKTPFVPAKYYKKP